MRNRQWFLGVMLTAALAASGAAGAQQTQKPQGQKQGQKQAGTSQAKPAPFDPCTGDGLPPASQMAPFAPGSPSNIDPPMPKTVKGSITCSHGKCKAVKSNSSYAQPPENASQNAFPMGKSEAAQQKANGVNAPEPSAAQANPFPEAQSRAAQDARQKAEDQPPPQQGNYSSSDQRLPGVNALGNGPVVNDSGQAEPAFDPELAKKDDKVGNFYLRSGDWAGAYGRFKEATQVDPQDLHAVIGLAMAADHLGKRDEAIRNYKLYLDVKPNGRESKDALKALKRLAGKQ
ncbi:MAG: tetratricopeptide repeat protein [Acidobacteriaceae bacterium]